MAWGFDSSGKNLWTARTTELSIPGKTGGHSRIWKASQTKLLSPTDIARSTFYEQERVTDDACDQS